jgi:putative transposase
MGLPITRRDPRDDEKRMNPDMPMRFFEVDDDLRITERRLPHWSQAGTVSFITWRTVDSMPPQILDAWRSDRLQWLHAHGVDANRPDWSERLYELGKPAVLEFQRTFWNRWHDALDAGHGSCVLRTPALAEIVANALHHFDGERYRLLDFVIMPNHVHLLASFPDEQAMLDQCESWKHFTATRINRRLGDKGRFWQADAFDHLLRSEEQFQYLRRYIADNPAKAGLTLNKSIHFSRNLEYSSRNP